MSVQQLNFALFELINASEHASHFVIRVAIFIANDLFYWVILGFILAWFKGDFLVKKFIVKATIFTLFAFSISQIISTIFYMPRPFVMELGRTIIEHQPNGSFPSDHMLFFSTIACSYLFSPQKRVGALFLLFAFMVAWSRVYLGVHFPLDMIGALLIALSLNIMGLSIWRMYGHQLVEWISTIYGCIFSNWIRKGYIRK